MNSSPSAYFSWASVAAQTPVPALQASSPLSGYSPAPFTSTGTSLLEGVNSFLLSNQLTKTSTNIKSWEVPSP